MILKKKKNFLNRFGTPCIRDENSKVWWEGETAGSDVRAGRVGQEIKGLGPLGRPGEYIRRSTKRKDCRVDLPTYSFWFYWTGLYQGTFGFGFRAIQIQPEF